MAVKLLVVDDEPAMERLVSQLLRLGDPDTDYEITYLNNGDSAFEYLQSGKTADVVLSDINMPGRLDGLALLREVHEKKLDDDLAMIIVSAYGDVERARVAIQNGAFDFIQKPIDKDDLRFSIHRAVSHVQERRLTRALNQRVEEQARELESNMTRLRLALNGFIEAMTLTVETRDPYTAGHQRRVSDLGRAIATEMGLTPDEIEGTRVAGIIHDLGKIYVPSEILNKPGRLQDIEMNLIKIHPEVAWQILKPVEFPWPVAEIVYQHHERLDGSGYPKGLKGEEIRIEARILAVADVVEAMASHRPYRAALGIEVAMQEIEKNSGRFYEQKAVEACQKLFREKGYAFQF